MTTKQTVYVPSLVAPDWESFGLRQAITGFLAGFGQSTREAYSLDLRQWMTWCASHDLEFPPLAGHVGYAAMLV